MSRQPTYAILASCPGDGPEHEDDDVCVGIAQSVGRELGRAGTRIAVYSCKETYLDRFVVSGYLEGCRSAKKTGSIYIWHKEGSRGGDFAERSDPELQPYFTECAEPVSEWGAIFYRSMSRIDGIWVLGGSDFAFVAGLWSLKIGLPTLTLACMGGASRKLWEVMKVEKDPYDDEELAVMGERWSKRSTERLVSIGKSHHRRRRPAPEAGAAKTTLVATSALLALTVLLPILALMALWSASPSVYLLLFVIPSVAGAAGASLRHIWDQTPIPARSYATSALLGAGSGFAYSLLFLMNQASADSDLFDQAVAANVNRTAILTISTVLVGLAGGFAMDAVYRKLRSGTQGDLETADT
jgi:hypothetical protein